MALSSLECAILRQGDRVVVLSPIIGRATLTVATDDVISPGHIIGEMWRLNKRFTLKLPDDCFGRIVLMKGCDRMMPFGYGEPMFEFEEIASYVRHDDARKSTAIKPAASVDAPMDGMFYLAPSPKDPPYVKVGDVIAPGQTIGLIEVMKCFYPLKYQGRERVKIVDIKVKSASPVSLGAPILIIDEG